MGFKDHMPFLKRLLGLAVEEVSWDGESLGLSFGGGWCLAIHNRFAYRIGADQSSAFQQLKGALVLRVSEDRDGILLKFAGDQVLEVDLTDDAFHGPEAMQLKGPSGEIVVWN